MPIFAVVAIGAAIFKASAKSDTLVAECAAVLLKTSLIWPKSETSLPKPFITLVAMSAASANSIVLACANSSVLPTAFAASKGFKPLRTKFSRAFAASVALYFVVAPSRCASSSIALNSLFVALLTARTRAIASSNFPPASRASRPNEKAPNDKPKEPNVEVILLVRFFTIF